MQPTIKRKPVASRPANVVSSESPSHAQKAIVENEAARESEISPEQSPERKLARVDTPMMNSGEFTPRNDSVLAGNVPLSNIESHIAAESLVEEGELRPDLDEQLEHLKLETEDGRPPPHLPDPETLEGAIAGAEVSSERPGKTSKFKNAFNKAELKQAFNEVKHFTGGLLSHPYEATAHYSVLRHSSGIVYYSGPTTSVAVTVFSDQPLPAERSLWLQKRGFSGNIGMKVKASRGNRSSWINVTPSTNASPDLLPKEDERAWQRDITKHLKKTKTHKSLCKHLPNETNVVRIPHVAEDGYFRIVLCVGREVLCPSPVFRYASSSLDPSVLRGASLTSLPMEMGVMVGSLVSRYAAHAATAGTFQPITSAIQSAAQPYEMGGLTQIAASTAYDESGAADRVDDILQAVDDQYEEKRELDFSAATGGPEEAARTVGADEGPVPPYPIRFSGRVVQGSGQGRLQFGVPTASVTDVDADTPLRLSGVYMGWAAIVSLETTNQTASEIEQSRNEELVGAENIWHKAIIVISPRVTEQISVVQEKDALVHLCRDFGATTFFGVRLEIIVLASLRSSTTSAGDDDLRFQEQQIRMRNDIAIASASLARPAWSAENVLKRIESESSGRSFIQRVVSARSETQKRLDKLPIQMLGVKTDSSALKDQLVGRGGICVKR